MTTDLSKQKTSAEPWMRGTHTELDALRRGVVHALELSLEDAERWVADLPEASLEARPSGLPSIAFHLRHIARSLDRLLTYAEDRQLSEGQLSLLHSESTPDTSTATLKEYRDGVEKAMARILCFPAEQLEQPRGIGRMRLPTTVGGLLVHCAEHTQRHSGQMVTTAKLVVLNCTDQANH